MDKKPFHLVGFSMGGMIAGVYAALYPSHVRCLSLLCPGGKCLFFIRESVELWGNANRMQFMSMLQFTVMTKDLTTLYIQTPESS